MPSLVVISPGFFKFLFNSWNITRMTLDQFLRKFILNIFVAFAICNKKNRKTKFYETSNLGGPQRGYCESPVETPV